MIPGYAFTHLGPYGVCDSRSCSLQYMGYTVTTATLLGGPGYASCSAQSIFPPIHLHLLPNPSPLYSCLISFTPLTSTPSYPSSSLLSPFTDMPACTPFITLILTGNSYGYATHNSSHSTSTSSHPAYTSCVFILSLRLLHNQHPYVLWHIHPCILLDPAAPATLVHHCILPVLGAYSYLVHTYALPSLWSCCHKFSHHGLLFVPCHSFHHIVLCIESIIPPSIPEHVL